MTEAPLPQWSDEIVADSFRAEIRARFEAHNKAFREREAAELAAVLREHPEKRGQPGYDGGDRDSSAWSFYQACEIRIESNVVTIISPSDSISMDLVYLFENTTAAWSKPFVKAVIIDGAPRFMIEIVLVATWDDSLDAAWRKDGNDKRQVLVELDEDEIAMFLDFLARRGDALPVLPALVKRVRDLAQIHLAMPLGWNIDRHDAASVEQMHRRAIEAQHFAVATLELLEALEKALVPADRALRASLRDRLKIALEYLP